MLRNKIYQHKNGTLIEFKKDFGSVISGYVLDSEFNRTERRFYARKYTATCVVSKSNIMEYVTIEDGRQVLNKGWIVIDSVRHYIKDGWVVCNNTLNQRRWNVTKKKSVCSECAKLAGMKPNQLTLF